MRRAPNSPLTWVRLLAMRTIASTCLRVVRNHRRAAYDVPASEYEGLNTIPVGIDPEHCPEYLVECGT